MKKRKTGVTFYPDDPTLKAIDSYAAIKNVSRNTVLQQLAKRYLASTLKKLVIESPEYQYILDDYQREVYQLKKESL
ncbi:hypothetical protein FCL47_23580 [Desulfopila sp. IMCC35006]|uniref:hypothetical protein n=1 Tax=Desulfopila sp. IMCC35006 TaxID=2569542 RepID=UPI0010AC03C6|nr:hypothetical protein [Desulfopila sp. IMCC35006]TKB23197.1 hypothetical protein FCL47_23580 [Desulfopila sp. IMCC35006]